MDDDKHFCCTSTGILLLCQPTSRQHSPPVQGHRNLLGPCNLSFLPLRRVFTCRP